MSSSIDQTWPGTTIRRHRRPALRRKLSTKRKLTALAAVAVLAISIFQIAAAPARAMDLPSPTRAMFYYPWFGETWHSTDHYRPALGQYSSDNPTIVAAHVAAMRYAGMQATIASWWGQGQHNEQVRFPQLYAAAAAQGLGVIPYYEPEGQGDTPLAQIQSDLAYLRAYANANPTGAAWIGGKPVIFVYNTAGGCARVSKWKQATHGFTDWYVNMKVFSGYGSCADQPSSWHQYGPAVAEAIHLPYSFNISPGFWHYNETTPRLPRDPARWSTNVSHMLASGARWQLVTSFNEWGESTSVEPSPSWQSPTGWGTYLDELHRQIYGVGPAPSPTGSPSPTVSPSPTSSPTVSPSPTPTTTTSPTVSPTTTTTSPSPTPSPTATGGDLSVMAAGDIVCANCTGYGMSSGADARTATLITSYNPQIVLTLGDNQYESGTLAEFNSGWGRISCALVLGDCDAWGQHLAVMYPSVGNHEYLTSNAQGYRDYFATRLAQIGSDTAAPSGKLFYSFDRGAWHFIAIDSNCSPAGGCGVGSPQYAWLLADLAANNGRPTIAYWHHPRWSSGEHGNNTSMSSIWNALVADLDVQVVLNGHDHDYERLAPMGTAGPATGGLREFVVGTGGKNHYCVDNHIAGQERFDCSTFGLLGLTLHVDGSWQWTFYPAAGAGSFTDSGSQVRR